MLFLLLELPFVVVVEVGEFALQQVAEHYNQYCDCEYKRSYNPL